MKKNVSLRFYKSDLRIVSFLRPYINNIYLKLGLVPKKYTDIMDVFNTYKEYRELQNCSKTEAVQFCAKYYKSSRRNVENIVHEME